MYKRQACHSRRCTSGYGTFDRSDYDTVHDNAVRDVQPELPASQFVLPHVNGDRNPSTHRFRNADNLIDFDTDVDTSTPLTVVHRRRENVNHHYKLPDERRVSTDHRIKSVIQSVPAKHVKSVGTDKPSATRRSSIASSKPKHRNSSPQQTDTESYIDDNSDNGPLQYKPRVTWRDHSVDKDDDLSLKNRRPVKQFNRKELPVRHRLNAFMLMMLRIMLLKQFMMFVLMKMIVMLATMIVVIYDDATDTNLTLELTVVTNVTAVLAIKRKLGNRRQVTHEVKRSVNGHARNGI